MDWCPPGHQPIPAYVLGIQVLANQAKSADTQREYMIPRVVEVPASLLVVKRIVLRDPFESLLAGSFAEHVPTYDKSGTTRTDTLLSWHKSAEFLRSSLKM
jgi:hypothetical protein